MEWRTINTNLGYEISDEGQVRNKKTGKILKGIPDKDGYLRVHLYNPIKNFYVHRLVAQAFLDSPKENQTEVHHKDGNRQNNNINNLEWVTPAENTRHAVNTGLMLPTKERAVVQFDLDGNKIAKYVSMREAARATNSNDAKICLCCQLQRKQHNGFQWRYENECGEKL